MTTNITFPAGRLVQGSLYEMQTKDGNGQLRVYKSGQKVGQPNPTSYFAVAFPKNGTTDWKQTAWGAAILAEATASAAQYLNRPNFAWKIVDGDSTVPNEKGKLPCEMEGFPGSWVVRFSSGFLPKVYRLAANGKDAEPYAEKDAIKLGDWVEVAGSTKFNGDQLKPGMYLNHSMVCFRGIGDRIVHGPDASSVGFGASPVPAGVSTVPQGSVMAAPAPTVAPAPPPVTVAPNPGFLNVPAPAAPKLVMTALANGATAEQFRANGWTDAAMISSGYARME